MIGKKILVIVTILAAAILASAAPAFASGPDCSSGRNKRGYDAGVLIGKSIVRQAWNGIGRNPDRFDEFVDIVRDAVRGAIANLPDEASDYVLCRAKGLSQGTCDELGAIQGTITNQCLLDGQVWGDLSADLYCALSIEFEGQDVLGILPTPPDTLCGERFEDGCHDHFVSYAQSVVECRPYTRDPWDEVFTDWKLGMCIYETPEP